MPCRRVDAGHRSGRFCRREASQGRESEKETSSVRTFDLGESLMAKRRAAKAAKGSGPTETVDVVESRCPKCGSSDRTKYINVIKRDISGIGTDGEEYNRVVWRTTYCKKCGQRRVDRSFVLTHGVKTV